MCLGLQYYLFLEKEVMNAFVLRSLESLGSRIQQIPIHYTNPINSRFNHDMIWVLMSLYRD